MSNEVQFEDENPYKTKNTRSNEATGNHQSGLVSWLMKIGLVKTSKQANGLLLGVAILGIVITASILLTNFNKKDLSKNPKYQLPSGLIKNP